MESLDKDTVLSLIKYDLSFVTAPVHFSVEGITAIMLIKILTGLLFLCMYFFSGMYIYFGNKLWGLTDNKITRLDNLSNKISLTQSQRFVETHFLIL
jgi:hypothetical protein